MAYNTPIVFTCDIDWAPEFAIDYTIDFFENLGIKLTLFATHSSNVVKSSGLEIGIHPYLSRVTEPDYQKVINDLKNIYPDAIGSRTHRNYFGYTTPKYLTNAGLKYDISVVNWLQPSFGNLHFSGLKTFTYSWEDGLHFDYKLRLTHKALPYKKDVCIFNIHPIVIYLNQDKEEIRKAALKGIKDLTKVKQSHIDQYIHKDYGIKNIITDFTLNKKSIELNQFINSYFKI